RKKGLKPDSLKKLFSVYPKYKNHNKKGCDFQRNTNFSYSSQPPILFQFEQERNAACNYRLR
ncbi:hypothetical protein MKA30_19195, partial [[Clostridium] innocuum]|nr:hypothetical protein [[Clostridium] innocuum]